jgi:predicted transcriptional regulator of viral defense system
MADRSLRARALQEVVFREPVFTSADVVRTTGATIVAVSKLMRRLSDEGTVARVMRGLWANPHHALFSPYLIVGRLADIWQTAAYVSGISALHLHGMLSQIPREIHVITADAHTPRTTPVGRFVFHHLQRELLDGTQPGDPWGRFAVATPEKALFDTIYLGLYRGRRWAELPELELPKHWDWTQWDSWLRHVEFAPFRRQLEQARSGLGAA